MNTRLFQRFSDEKERLVREFKQNPYLIDYFVRLLEREMKDTPFFSDFNDPNWVIKQAAQSGRYQALEDVRNLFKSIEEK